MSENTNPQQPVNAQPANTPAPAASAPAQPSAPAAEAPKDAWADFKAPEGYAPEQISGVVAWAKKNGLDPKAALAVAARDKEAGAAAEAEFKRLSEKGWLEDLQKDPVLGGDKVRETMVTVMRAVDKLPADVQKMIKDHGVLYNPILVRVLHSAGSMLREDTFVRSGQQPPEKKQEYGMSYLTNMFAQAESRK